MIKTYHRLDNNIMKASDKVFITITVNRVNYLIIMRYAKLNYYLDREFKSYHFVQGRP